MKNLFSKIILTSLILISGLQSTFIEAAIDIPPIDWNIVGGAGIIAGALFTGHALYSSASVTQAVKKIAFANAAAIAITIGSLAASVLPPSKKPRPKRDLLFNLALFIEAPITIGFVAGSSAISACALGFKIIKYLTTK
jgi:hypothetical protein